MFERRHFARTLAAIAVAAAAIPNLALARTVTMEAAGAASVTGFLPQMLAKHTAQQGLQIQLALDQTLTKSLLKLGNGQLQTSVVPPSAFEALKAGKGPYAKMGEQASALAPNVRSLFGFLGSVWHSIAWADAGISSWADAKGKRVYIGPPAGAANAQIIGMIEAASGLKEGVDYTAVKLPWGAALQGFQDGQFDIYVAPAAVGQQTIVELSLQRPLVLLPVPRDKTIPVRLQMEGSAIPARTYSGQANADQDIWTWGTTMMMAAHKDLPDDIAYTLTKTYWQALPEMKKANALLVNQDPGRPFVGVVAPLHPGALKFYREAGIEVPAALLGQ